MDSKDLIPILLSSAALVFSILTWYFAYFHRRTKAILCYVSREFGGGVNDASMTRELTYSFSNTGECKGSICISWRLSTWSTKAFIFI